MKKTLTAVAAFAAALFLAGCASTKKAAPAATGPVLEDADKPLVVCGTYNEDKSSYTIDLSKVAVADSTVVANSDGSITVTFEGNWKQIIVPIPYNDPDFMLNMTKCTFTVSSDELNSKNFAWKLSSSMESSWGSGGGLLGQGENCVGFMFRNYEDAWDNTPVELYFNGDDTSFGKFTDKMYKGIKGIAMCDNQTQPKPFTFTIKSIVFEKDSVQ